MLRPVLAVLLACLGLSGRAEDWSAVQQRGILRWGGDAEGELPIAFMMPARLTA